MHPEKDDSDSGRELDNTENKSSNPDEGFKVLVTAIKERLDTLAVRGVIAKLEARKELGIIKIYTEDTDAIKRASSGIPELLELAYNSAEHHPYWMALFHASEIAKLVVDSWQSELTAEQMGEIIWRSDEIKSSFQRLMQ